MSSAIELQRFMTARQTGSEFACRSPHLGLVITTRCQVMEFSTLKRCTTSCLQLIRGRAQKVSSLMRSLCTATELQASQARQAEKSSLEQRSTTRQFHCCQHQNRLHQLHPREWNWCGAMNLMAMRSTLTTGASTKVVGDGVTVSRSSTPTVRRTPESLTACLSSRHGRKSTSARITPPRVC